MDLPIAIEHLTDLPELTRRQVDILTLHDAGADTKMIASCLGVSVRTVQLKRQQAIALRSGISIRRGKNSTVEITVDPMIIDRLDPQALATL